MAVKVQDTILHTFCEDLFESNNLMAFCQAFIGKYGAFLKFTSFKESDLKTPEAFSAALWQKSELVIKQLMDAQFEELDAITLFLEFKHPNWVEKTLYI